MRLRAIWAWVAAALLPAQALAWGPEGHSIVAELAQRRLSPRTAAEVEHLLGPGRSLASIVGPADEARDERPETALERLMTELRCGSADDRKREALRHAVQLVGDIHEPLDVGRTGRQGSEIAVEVRLTGARTCGGGPCPLLTYRSDFRRVWDSTLIEATTGNWRAYADRLERGWLASPEARGADAGTPAQWAEETHRAARAVWTALPDSRVVDDGYYARVLPTLDRQLGLAGLRLASFLNDIQAPGQCRPR